MARFFTLITALLLLYQPAKADEWLEARSAQIQTLDKITARISTLAVGLDNPIRFGTLEILVHRCAYRPPEESPEDAAFLTVRDVGHDPTIAPKIVFTGWVFSSSPAISGLEHAVYDVTLLRCDR